MFRRYVSPDAAPIAQELSQAETPFYVHDDAPDVFGFAGLRERISTGANAVTEWRD